MDDTCQMLKKWHVKVFGGLELFVQARSTGLFSRHNTVYTGNWVEEVYKWEVFSCLLLVEKAKCFYPVLLTVPSAVLKQGRTEHHLYHFKNLNWFLEMYTIALEKEQLPKAGKLLVNQQVFIEHSSSVFRTLWCWVWNMIPTEDCGRSAIGKYCRVKRDTDFHFWIFLFAQLHLRKESRFRVEDPEGKLRPNSNIQNL